MKQKPNAIDVHANHKRGILSALRLLDQMLCEIEEYAQGREVASVLYRERNTLTAAQKQALTSETAAMKQELKEIKDRLGLAARKESVAREIWAKSSGLWETLVETTSRHLKRYGPVSEELAEFLDPRIEQLIEHLLNLSRLSRGEALGEDRPAGDDANGSAPGADHDSREEARPPL